MSEFPTKNEAVQFVQEGIKRGAFKPCLYIKVIGGANDFAFVPYQPSCEQDSFTHTRDKYYILQCPADCSLFKDRYVTAALEEKEKKKQARLHLAKTIFTTPFIWFGKLPTLTQALLLFIIIVLVSPKLAASIIAIIKALK